MKKYKTGGYAKLIEAVEVIKETPKTVTIKYVDWLGKQHQFREAKSGLYYSYHDTFADAKAHLLARQLGKIESLRQRLASAVAKLAEIEALEDADTFEKEE